GQAVERVRDESWYRRPVRLQAVVLLARLVLPGVAEPGRHSRVRAPPQLEPGDVARGEIGVAREAGGRGGTLCSVHERLRLQGRGRRDGDGTRIQGRRRR